MRAAALAGLALCLAACGGGSDTSDSGTDAAVAADDGVPDLGAPDAGPTAPMATTTSGPVIGNLADGVQAFLGIPYAAPPTGDARWRPPAPPVAWTTPRRTTRRPNACPQSLMSLTLGNEDCLYANVHTPDPRPTGAPVMVWIHGGAWTLGEGVQTDGGTLGDVLAREGHVVVVSFNYRLGQLGFLAHPALDAESPDHVSGNYGFLDQVAALRWVHDNIAAFGGDPANVTVFGESAGGEAVCAHLTSHDSRGLFARAIIESGPCGIALPTLVEAETQGAEFAAALHCDTAPDVTACLRAVTAHDVLATLPPAADIVSSGPGIGQWGPLVDGHVFPTPWVDAIDAGDVADVPVLGGFNRDEGTIFLALRETTGAAHITAANYRDTVASIVGDTYADAIVARYPPSDFGGDANLAAARALGDGGLICPSRRALVGLAAHVPVRAYLFTYPNAQFLLPASFPLGAFHSAEVQFVFGHPVGGAFDADGVALHDAMLGYWTRFASQDGDPDGAGAPAWPAFSGAGGMRIVFDTPLGSADDDYDATCAFWAGIPLLH